MTVAEQLLNDLFNYKKQIGELIEKIGEIEINLVGMELRYKGNYACVEYIDSDIQNASLYIEYENGDSDSVYIPLEELLELLS